jgi:FkbM family methyltransferase
MNIICQDISCVIDVGANEGHFGQSLLDFGYQGKIYSIEPVERAFESLAGKTARHKNWHLIERCAIGNDNGMVQINVSDDSVYSSLLHINRAYVDRNPKSQVVKVEEVPMYTLDFLLGDLIGDQETILLKIDTQGYEREVLEGASGLVARSFGLKIEIPLYSIYEDASFNFFETIEWVRDHGFKPYSFNIEGVDLNTGRVNTIDGLFFRT